jgi:peptidoglycan hydrolase-like protein with peptidoglycan-binding domain
MRLDSRDKGMRRRIGIGSLFEALGGVVATSPATAGGVTAFAVAMAFFASNAMFFQDQSHPSAFFETRPMAGPRTDVELASPAKEGPNVTRFVLNSPETTEPVPVEGLPVPRLREQKRTVSLPVEPKPAPELPEGGERDVAGIQELLSKLGYYEGEVDGLAGPMTVSAIDAYKDNTGLRGIELTNAELMQSLRNNLDVTAAIPAPRPGKRPETPAPVEDTITELLESARNGEIPSPAAIPSAEVVKVQAALKAFGNTDITIDGLAGDQTQAAIREFQTLFRIPVTGEVDGALLDKMRDVGLIQ